VAKGRPKMRYPFDLVLVAGLLALVAVCVAELALF